MHRTVLLLLMTLAGVGMPALACVGGFIHQWQELPAGAVVMPRAISLPQLARFLEPRLSNASGTWGIALVKGERAGGLAEAFLAILPGEASASLRVDDSEGDTGGIGWQWAGFLPPFGETGGLAERIPSGYAGMVWIDPVDLREEPGFRLDPTFPGALALRLGWSARGIFRVMACRADGEVVLIDELPIVSVFELDCLFPITPLVGGIWPRRLSWQGVGSDRPTEVMLLPPFGFGQQPGVSAIASGTGN